MKAYAIFEVIPYIFHAIFHYTLYHVVESEVERESLYNNISSALWSDLVVFYSSECHWEMRS